MHLNKGFVYYKGQKIGTIQLVISKDNSRRALIASIVIVILLTIIIIAAISLTSILISSRHIFRPLKKLERAAEIIAGGNLETEIETSGQDEIGNLAKAFDYFGFFEFIPGLCYY